MKIDRKRDFSMQQWSLKENGRNGDGKPETAGEKLEVDDGRWKMWDGRCEMDDGRCEMDERNWDFNFEGFGKNFLILFECLNKNLFNFIYTLD